MQVIKFFNSEQTRNKPVFLNKPKFCCQKHVEETTGTPRKVTHLVSIVFPKKL